jgi:MOSC domain-containing protein YiiM
MKVVSLNVSQVQEVSHKGKTVLTGIFKKPTADKVLVHKDHLEGDAQGDLTVHGGDEKAVYAFSANHYDYWRHALSQPDLHFGQFGENLTITDLDEADFCIGDQLSIGECILEVSQPRVPCFKLGIALNNDKAPSLYSKHGATGIYFRIIESGFIAPNVCSLL